jgi:hypothetical protein
LRRSHHLLAVIGLVLVLAVGGSSPAAAQLPELGLPDADVPDVHVPEVQVPDVPGVGLPEVQVPSVQVPSVEAAPGIETPAVEVGGVQAGGGSAPAAPAPSEPTATTRTTGSGGGPGGGDSGTGGGSATGGESAADGGSTASGSASGRVAAAGRSTAVAARSAGARDTPRRARSRERRLRRLVAASRGCLAALPAAERRVLVLRAGLGPRDPRSRRATAARLDVPLAAVRRRERAGVRQLRALGGDCGGAAVSPSAASAAGAMLASTTTAGTAAGGQARPGGDGEPDAGGVLGASESSPRTGGAPEAPATVIPGVVPPGGGDASVYVLAGLAAMLIALLATRRSRAWILHPDD